MPTTFEDVDAAAFLRASVSQRRRPHYQGQTHLSTGMAPRRGSLLARIYPLIEDTVQEADLDGTTVQVEAGASVIDNEDI